MKDIKKIIGIIRKKKPLILNITNLVTMDFVANCLLAMGASPVMSMCEDELEELVKLSSAVYINIGTLDCVYVNLVKRVVDMSAKFSKPIILDPVGAGATMLRTSVSSDLMYKCDIVRGNASEIIALGSRVCVTKGVDSIHDTVDAETDASNLAIITSRTFVVSGAVDFITDGKREKRIHAGCSLMGSVTGMGCSMTAVIAAFRSVINDSFEAAYLGAYYFGVCGEIASLKHNRPSSFKVSLIDQLYDTEFNLIEGKYEV